MTRIKATKIFCTASSLLASACLSSSGGRERKKKTFLVGFLFFRSLKSGPVHTPCPRLWAGPAGSESLSPPQLGTQNPELGPNSRDRDPAAGQILTNHCHKEPSGSTNSAIKGYVIKSKRSKPKPIKSASRSIFVPSRITSQSCAVIEFPRIEPSLGPD